MKNISIFLILFTLSSFVAVCLPKHDQNKKAVQELNIRGNLPNFFGKALRGDSIKVAYLGGSITAQNGWRVFSLEGFKLHFPKAVFTEINAAIGGTGSNFGVFRLNDHVLKFNPDLVFVEFAVNDDGVSTEKIIRSMEGIVRQIWQFNPGTDICFVYTIKETFLETEQNGKLPASAVTMEKVADKYHIPTINFGFEVTKMVDRKQLIFKGAAKELNGVKVFSPDGVHPYQETGHHIYQTVLERSFDVMAAGKFRKRIKHILSKPIAPDYFSNTKMVDIPDVQLSKNWEVFHIKDQPLFAGFGKYLEKFGKASQSGETLISV